MNDRAIRLFYRDPQFGYMRHSEWYHADDKDKALARLIELQQQGIDVKVTRHELDVERDKLA